MNVYLFMGTHLPELQACLGQLAAGEAGPETARVHVPEGLPWPAPDAGAYQLVRYTPAACEWAFAPGEGPAAFVVVDPREPPVPQLERLAGALKGAGLEPAKVLTCVDCKAAEDSPQLRAWLEACIYYSDAVLLGNRAAAAKGFVREFQKHHEKLCYPCLFLLLKGPGLVEDPLEVLFPDTRRLSQLFDLPEAESVPAADVHIDASCDLDMEEPETDPYRHGLPGAEPPHAVPDAAPWIVRGPGSA